MANQLINEVADKQRQWANFSLFEKQFNMRKQKRVEDVNNFFKTIKSSALENKLPDELWLLVAELAYPEGDYYLHIVFQRRHVLVDDTYYLFSGSLDKFCKVMQTLRHEADLQLEQIEFNGRGLDTPVDAIWFEKDPLKPQPSRWHWLIYADKVRYNTCVEFIHKLAPGLSTSGKYDCRLF